MRSIRRATLVMVVASAMAALAGANPAYAASAWWHLSSTSAPSDLPPRGEGRIAVTAVNLGDASALEEPITLSDHLPAGVTAEKVSFYASSFTLLTRGEYDLGPEGGLSTLGLCTVESHEVRCTYPHFEEPLAAYNVFFPAVAPFERLEIVVTVKAKATAQSGEEARATITAGEGQHASFSQPLTFSSVETPFGFESSYSMVPEEEGGSITTRAGLHPFQLTTSLNLNQTGDAEKPPALVRDLGFDLPQGTIGNPTPFPQCTLSQFAEEHSVGGVSINDCPTETAVGVAFLRFTEIHKEGIVTGGAVPVFNLSPKPGEPARFGFDVLTDPVIIDTSLRTGRDYGVTVTVHHVPQGIVFLSSVVTFWGVPSDARHDGQRGWICLDHLGTCESRGEEHPAPFLTMPTSCQVPFTTTVEGDSWAEPAMSRQVAEPALYTLPLSLDACNQLSFGPGLEKTVPDVNDASTPTGLAVDVHVPQEAALNPNGVAESAVEQIEVTLPEGMTVNPGGADGLTSCTEHEIGFEGPNPSAVGGFQFSERLPEPLEPGVNFCPGSSKIATVTIHTPLLPHPIEGFVYLATPSINGEPGMNPDKSLIAMYLVAQDPVSGVLVKLPMRVELNQPTGQLVTTVDNPELPFEDAELHFFGGSRAPLATPAMCGTYTTTAVFTPWSGNAPVDSNATFTIDTGPGGGSCLPPTRPFAPSFQAGTTNLQAGAYTPFTTTLGHPDGNQYLGLVSMKLPPGLMGSLSGVKLCPEPQASEGLCSPESLIGHTVVTAGLGSNPAVVARPGNVYITGPYNGHGACKVGEPGCAPFGLTIANPAETGPFDLEKGTPCDCVVVRAKIEVNPVTAQLTVTSDPFPTILKGVPLQLQHVNVTIERPGFTFNPTNCAPLSIGGTISSGEGVSVPVSTPFQVANCATLGFKPKFKVSTPGKTSRKDGAGLDVKLVYPAAPFGSQANIAKVKVDLPKQLPSRLSTLQKACLAATFEANPAACPTGSRVGFAKAVTPVLPVPLEGPAYFVSYGAKKFPELIVVLQGYGVTVDLHGETFISKAGITTSTFRQVPDVPVGSFELKLPQGPNSALAANANLCNATYTVTSSRRVWVRVRGRSMYATVKVTKRVHGMQMPTAFTAQNGIQIHVNTPISVTGCGHARRARRGGKR